jgi:hypothetical protein
MLIIMGQRGKVTDVSEQASCEICGLTARTKDEIEEHISHAHGTNGSRVSSEQKLILFQKILRRHQQPAKKKSHMSNMNAPDMI